MSRKMLINAQHPDQVRVAIVDGTTLESYQVDMAAVGLMRGNIYRGVVANVQPSLSAAFIDLGTEKHGFLSVEDLLPGCYHKKPEAKGRPRIEQVLERGKPLLVQVTKDGVGNKGPALTTNLSLAGRYLVLMPLDEVRGISRKVGDDAARKKLRERLGKLTLPDGMGVIVRTNGLDQNQATLNRDVSALLRLWRRIQGQSDQGKGARLLYSDQNLILQALRDHLDPSIDEVMVDDAEAHAQAERYLRTFMPRSKLRLTHYRERMPLFSKNHLEPQIERIYSREVPLTSGGSIVIDPTEALTAIDVNSGRTTKADDHEETILHVNLEAANEVARQLRLRDIGGLVVIDFIDMRLRKHQSKVERALRDAMKGDRARHTISRISRNGLVEINRQRLKQALRHRTHRACPTCSGVGTIPSLEFAAMSLLGRIEARAAIGSLVGVMVALHPEVADALQNHHRRELVALEKEFDLKIEVIASPSLHRTEERVEWRQREAGSGRKKSVVQPAVSATDLTAPTRRRRRSKSSTTTEPVAASEERGQSRSSAGKTRTAAAGKTRAAASQASSRIQDDRDGEQAPKPKRRRRGGSKARAKTADAKTTAAKTAAAGDAKPSTEAAAAATGDEPAKPKRRRRGSRGGRKRRKPAAEPVDSHDQQTAGEKGDNGNRRSPIRDDGPGEADGSVVRRRVGGFKPKRPARRPAVEREGVATDSAHDRGTSPRASEPPFHEPPPPPDADPVVAPERPRWRWWRTSDDAET